MEVREALQKRRSIRKFKADKVSGELIDCLMHAAMSGPSAMNRTPWEFYVVSDEEKLADLRLAGIYTGIVAPLAVVVCGNRERFIAGAMDSFWVHDCAAASENMLLQGVELGLGSVWCGVYPQSEVVAKVQSILGVNEDIVPLNIIYFGYPDQVRDARDQYNEAFVHLL